MKIFLSLAAVCLIAACGQTQSESKGGALSFSSPAKEPCGKRICTMHYRPVCATLLENGQTVRRTFGNRCTVCSDTGKIVNVQEGECDGVR